MTVGEISRLTGVTVRTLHHYDQIGLVVPVERTDAGYRLYGAAEIERLQEVLFLREIGFGLAEIESIVGDAAYDRETALRAQRRMLEAKAEHLLAMIETIDAAIHARGKDEPMSGDEMLGVFGDFDPAGYEQEAEERWGDPDAFVESRRRTSGYTRDDWKAIQGDAAAIDQAFIEMMDAGTPPDSPEAAEVVARHRAHITKWFYDCTPEIHAGPGQMYIADQRFTDNIDKARTGLAAYISEAIGAAVARG